MNSLLYSLWRDVGIAVFWLTWPLLYVRLYKTKRARVIVRCGDEVLLVKSWYGSGRWQLPGGGMKRKETIAMAARRELEEETNLRIEARGLQKIGAEIQVSERGLRFYCQAFMTQFSYKPDILPRRREIIAYRWVQHPLEAFDEPMSKSTRHALRAVEK